MEKAVLAGLIGSGSVLHLSLATSVPNIQFGHLLKLIRDQKQWSITVVNMQYARVSTEEGGTLLPSATYHVMLGRSPSDTVDYLRVLSEKLCGEEEFELKFEEKSLLEEAFSNSCSILTVLRARSSQLIAEKYATMA